MTRASELGGAIIAAGAGSRFQQAGWTVPKPLVPVAGVPLIEHAIRHFLAAGITSLVVILNEQGRECVGWVRRRFPDLDLQFIVKTTRSSYESFREVLRRADRERTLVSTVDAWCPDGDFVRFVEAAPQYPPGAAVLAVTPFVADDRPLWVSLDASGRVVRLGGDSGDLVTAGFYLVPGRLGRLTPPPAVTRLRDFLAWLVERREPLYGVVLPAVVDVDRTEDVALAEALFHRATPDTRREGNR